MFRAKGEIAALLNMNLQQKVKLDEERNKLMKRINYQQQQLSWLGSSKPRQFPTCLSNSPSKPDYIMVTEDMEHNIKGRLNTLKDLILSNNASLDLQASKTSARWLSPFSTSCLTTPETQDDDSDKVPTSFTEKVQLMDIELTTILEELSQLVTKKMVLIEKLQHMASATAASVARSSAVLETNLEEKLRALLAMIAIDDSSNTPSANTSSKYACLNPLAMLSSSHNESPGLDNVDHLTPEVQLQNVAARCLTLLEETYQAMELKLEQERYGKSVIFFDQEARILALHESLQASQDELTKTKKESTSARELLAEVTADFHRAKERNQALLDQVAHLETQLQSVNEIAERRHGDFQELTSNHRYLLMDRDALQVSLNSEARVHEQEVEDLLDEIKTCREQIETLTVEKEKDVVKKEKTKRELKEAVEDIAKFYQEIQRLRESIDQSATEIKSLQRHLEGTSRELESVRGQLAASIEAHQTEKKALLDERDALQLAHNALEEAKAIENRLRNELQVEYDALIVQQHQQQDIMSIKEMSMRLAGTESCRTQDHDLPAKYTSLVHRSTTYSIF